nr:ribonuclease H-like domain-containing protein [Tanacetum cinerariifolium]
MVTRYRVGSNRPPAHLTFHVSSVLPLPKSYRDAFNDLNWQNAMCDEYHALIKNNTLTLVPRPANTNIVRCIWLFRHKYHAYGTLSRYKARLVAKWEYTVRGCGSSSQDLLQHIIRSLHQEFSMTYLGSLNYFLGISVTRYSSRIFLSQKKYALEILERAGYGLQLLSSSTTDLVAYSDADWAGCPTTCRSTSGYCIFLEYRGVANAVVETCWLRNLQRELHSPLSSATLVYCNNVRVLHVPSKFQFADIFTKGLPSALFEEFRTSLSVRCPPAPTVGEC